ncbi:hypothetical protein AB0H12_11540 [Actinosynnema sp. NPDC023794]
MSEADLREGLRAAVGDEPPLDFDADELIRRAQHVRRRRRALVAVAVATLALTGTVLALPGVVDQRRGVDAASGSVLTTTASESASEAGVPAATPPAPTVEQPTTVELPSTTAAKPLTGGDTELFAYLRKRFTEVAPDAKVMSADAAATTDAPSGHPYAWLTFVDRVGTSRVMVRFTPPGSGMTREAFCDAAGCEGPIRQEDGSYVTSSWTALPEPEGVMHTVAHFRLDGSVVEVRGFAYQPPVDGVVREKVALTYDQLASLATDPLLGVS